MLSTDILKRIREIGNFLPTEDDHDSYYNVNYRNNGKPIQVRVSNHGTYLRTWVDLANKSNSNLRLVDPSRSINISVVFVDEGNDITKDCIGQSNCDDCKLSCIPEIVKGITEKGRPYEVLQYTYQSKVINSKYLNSLVNAIGRAIIGGRFIDPLKSLENKRASVRPMKPQEPNQNNILKCNRNMNINKQIVRLTESQLRNIIVESVEKILREADFKRVDNLNDYISQNGLQGKMASKFQRVNAQQGSDYIRQYLNQHPELSREEVRNILKNGAPLSTVASDGTQETNNLVTRNHTILNNVGNPNNRWAVEKGTFNRKYQPSDEGEGVFKPAGKPMRAYPVNEPISFTAPWGEEMNIDKGGQILQDPDNPNDIYGISGKDFDNTYRFQESTKRVARLTENQLRRIIVESVSQILNEISKDTVDNAYIQSMQRDVSVDALSPAKKRQYDKLVANGYRPEVALNMVVGNQRWAFANRINQDITNGGKVTPYNVTQGKNGMFPFSKDTKQNKRLQNIQNKTNQQQIQKTAPFYGVYTHPYDGGVYGALDYIPKDYDKIENPHLDRYIKQDYREPYNYRDCDKEKEQHDMRPQV